MKNSKKNVSPCNPRVSIIMNCHNGDRFLKYSIETVLAQTIRDWELIFWDNQSTDNSKGILESYSDPRLRYFFAPTFTDLGEARNLAIAEAKGVWVAFLDVDDMWLPDKLEKQLEVVEQSDISLVYSRCFEINNEFGITKQDSCNQRVIPRSGFLPTKSLFEKLVKFNFIPFPTLLIKKEVLLEIGGVPPLKFSPDYYISLSIALNYQVGAVDKPLAYYRHHGENLSKKIKEKGYEESIEIVENLCQKHGSCSYVEYHHTRHAIYLAKTFNFVAAVYIILSIGIYNFLHCVFELIKMKRDLS